ncbi:selenium binding protein [Clostridium tertium]|uniref:selenium binding protein n=1 Tax=Clostridium tertium TaxID=1559 RepID=UPI002A83F342|nr:selenium binding protein [Clostridium tertium]MDY4604029.1 selenium binding protein [Clostridium tertium]
MYESYTIQSLPSKEYRELLGSAICVFNSNNSFIIENILRNDKGLGYNWHDLIDKTSGELLSPIKETITKNYNSNIAIKFEKLISQRNRIIHSFQITDKDGEQRLSTKDKKGKQYVITEDYLKSFIKLNEELSKELHKFRGY